jgi:hypothetical protein
MFTSVNSLGDLMHYRLFRLWLDSNCDVSDIPFLSYINQEGYIISFLGARGSVVGWGTMLQGYNAAGSNPEDFIGFFNWLNDSSRTMTMGSTQPLIDMSTRNFPGGKGRPADKADNLTSICESIV